MRYASRKDATQKAIVRALRDVGALVLILNEFDLLCHFGGRLYMIDAKTGQGKAGTFEKTERQEKLEAAGWPLNYVRDQAEALAVLGIYLEPSVSGEERRT